MADEIVQVLGFDADDAINTLNRLGDAVSNVSGRLTRFGKNLDRFNQQSGNSASGLTQAGNATDRLGQSLERTEKSVGRLTTSVELLSRIVYTQLVIKGLRLTEQALFDATKRAAELQVKLAEISGVAEKGTFSGLQDINDAVTGLAKELGVNQIDIASGLYTTIQNQIGGTKRELIDFNRVAGEFAVATGTKQVDAITLLSGTLNAYGLDVTRAEELASKFNKAIEVGNIEGGELAHVFGRVATRAAALGVTIDETLGLFETLTIRGINPNEAATQIGALITAFTKPSEAMKAALEGLNVPSGEFLIRMKGIAGALEAVRSQTDGSSSEMAKLFPNIRAVNGVVITASDNFERLNENIAATRDTALSLNKERFNLIFETDAKRVEREIANLRTEMTKIGEALLHTTADVFELVGGADGIIETLRVANPLVVALGAHMTTTFLATQAAAKGLTLFGTSLSSLLGRLGTLAVIGGVTKAAVTFGIDAIRDKSLETVKTIRQARKEAVEEFKRQEQDRLRTARDTEAEIAKAVLASTEAQRKAYNATRDQVRLQEKAFISTTESSLTRIINVRQDLVREIERAISDSQKTIEQSQRRIVDLQFDKDQRRFNSNLADVSDPDKVNRLLGRSITLARQAQSDLSKATNDEQISRALKLFDRASSTAEEARSIGERVGKRDLENRAVSTLNRLTDQQIAAEKRLQAAQDARRKGAQADLDAQKKATDEIKAQTKIITENLATVDQTPADTAKRQKIVKDAFAKLTQSALSRSDVSLAESLGLTQLAADIQRNLGSEIKLSIDADQTINSLQGQMTQAFETFKLKLNFDVSGLERVLGTQFQTIDQIAPGFNKALEEADQLRTNISKARQEQFELTKGARSEITALLDASDSVGNALARIFSGFGATEGQQARKLLEDFRTQARAMTETQDISRTDVTDLFNRLQKLQEFVQGHGSAFGFDVENFSQVVSLFNQIRQAGEQDSALLQQQQARLQELTAVIQSSGSVAAQFENAFRSGADELRSAADYWVNRVGSVRPTTRPQNFATGGLTRGSDTIATMLSPGEVVMNRNASQRFFSDLQRMNAGMVPQYRQAGGSVDNSVTVGDIHIHGAKQSFTARDVAREINREVRRGTVRR